MRARFILSPLYAAEQDDAAHPPSSSPFFSSRAERERLFAVFIAICDAQAFSYRLARLARIVLAIREAAVSSFPCPECHAALRCWQVRAGSLVAVAMRLSPYKIDIQEQAVLQGPFPALPSSSPCLPPYVAAAASAVASAASVAYAERRIRMKLRLFHADRQISTDARGCPRLLLLLLFSSPPLFFLSLLCQS